MQQLDQYQGYKDAGNGPIAKQIKIGNKNSDVGEDHWSSKLTTAKVREIRKFWDGGSKTQEDRKYLIQKYDMSRSGIDRVVSRKSWKHIK